MSDLTSLPQDITPGEFFQLVQETLSSQPAPASASAEKAQISLSGEGGGSWVMGFVGGKLVIEQGTADAPPVHVSLSVADFRAFLAGAVRDAVKAHVDAAAIDPAQLGKLYQSADKVEQIKAIAGDLQLVVTGAQGDHTLTLTTGGGAPNVDAPTCKAAIALPDFALLVAGKENPQAAFFQGKIQIDGDLNHVMMLMGTLMS
jgi:putative sterol carrier protein